MPPTRHGTLARCARPEITPLRLSANSNRIFIAGHVHAPVPARIDGRTKVDDRQAVVDAFNARGVGQARIMRFCWILPIVLIIDLLLACWATSLHDWHHQQHAEVIAASIVCALCLHEARDTRL